MSTDISTTAISLDSDSYTRWIRRGLEGLWLLTLVLVPLGYLERDYLSSEAAIAYVEIPKIFILRTLVGIMAVLWALEWAVRSDGPIVPVDRLKSLSTTPGSWLRSLKIWLSAQPGRWLALAVWFFLGTTLLSTILSGSLDVSLWGDVPGQDGYAFYNILCYVLLFAVIATHLKTWDQLWRIIGTLVAVGTVIGGYTILQQYGHDPLGLSERQGGFRTAFSGNTIFTAAVLMMTITVTVAAATISLREPDDNSGDLLTRARRWSPTLLIAWLWSLALTTQLLALAFTTSRGPWLGTLAASIVLIGLMSYTGGWRTFGRAAVFLGLPGLIAVAVSRAGVSIGNPVLWLGATLALIAVFLLASSFGWRKVGQLMLVGGITAAVIIAVFALPSWTTSGGGAGGSSDPTGQFSSVNDNVISRTLGGRLTHWQVSWELISKRPWFEFDNLSLPWLRQLIGYGPDLFRSTYLLRSPPEGAGGLPLEPDHAHNFLIHQTVEQGYLGLLSAAGLFVAVFAAGGYLIRNSAQGLSTSHKLLLAMLLAVVAGRFVEMLVGVARVSDLTILWALLGVFAALPGIIRDRQQQEITPTPKVGRRRSRQRAAAIGKPRKYFLNGQTVWRFAAVAVLLGGFGTLTWVKSLNYVRAAVVNSSAVEQFRTGDWADSLDSFEKAIDLAPDVTIYRNNRAELFLAFLINADRYREPACNLQTEATYDVCVAVQSYESNLNAMLQRPFYYRARIALGNAAFNLQLKQVAIRRYQEAVSMVPNSKAIRSALAEAYLEDGQSERAIEVLQTSLDIGVTSEALTLLGMAQLNLGQVDDAIDSLERALASREAKRFDRRSREVLADLYYERGTALWESGDSPAAIELLEKAWDHGLPDTEAIAALEILAVGYLELDQIELASHFYYSAGEIMLRIGQLLPAKANLERSLGLVDTGSQARSTRLLLAEIADAEQDTEAAETYRRLADR